MEIIRRKDIKDVFLICSKKHLDSRGWFQETYHMDKFLKNQLELSFVQDNLVYSNRNVLRGLHFQDKNGQGKLISCIRGKIFDVLVDLRKESSTYKKWISIELSEDDNNFIYVPPGFAHGYYVMEDKSLVHYKCTKHYKPENEIGIIWNDSDININWPNTNNRILSKRDESNKTVRALKL